MAAENQYSPKDAKTQRKHGQFIIHGLCFSLWLGGFARDAFDFDFLLFDFIGLRRSLVQYAYPVF
jgi:hypothetical protein